MKNIQKEFKKFKMNRDNAINKSNKNPTFKSNAKEGYLFKTQLIHKGNKSQNHSKTETPSSKVQTKDIKASH